MNKLFAAFTRTKHLTSKDFETTQLRRCLSTYDLTALAIGSTLGAGVYVVTGQVAKLRAGPAIVLSFSIAALASILSGLCYAELGARVPKAGSAYLYTYVTIGELCAFVVGWNLVLEYVVAAASIARAWSAFFDSLFGNYIHDSVINVLGKVRVHGLSEYVDVLAFIFIMIVTLILISGVKQSSSVNWVFTSINIFVIIFVIIAGLVFADLKNWDNFMPFGFNGVIAGAATCFYAFIGFDVVASSGEEAKTPSKSIPRAIIASLMICFAAYIGASAALTLMLPYNVLDENTALATGFEEKGFKIGKYFVAVGAMCGLSASALNALFPMPRILYAMGSDGVIFTAFSRVHEGTGIPVVACVASGILTGLLALLLDLLSLVEMLSVGTLLAYSVVSLCVLLLRYRPSCTVGLVTSDVDGTTADEAVNLASEDDDVKEGSGIEENSTENSVVDSKAETSGSEMVTTAGDDDAESSDVDNHKSKSKLPTKGTSEKSPIWMSKFTQRLVGGRLDEPTEETYSVVKMALVLFIVLTLALQSCLIWGQDALLSKDPFMVIFVVFLLISLLIVVEVLSRQPQSKTKLPFKTPLLPIVPLLGIFVNLYLTLHLSYLTWIRFTVWMIVGMSIYLFYGLKHSKEKENTSAKESHKYTQLKNNADDSE